MKKVITFIKPSAIHFPLIIQGGTDKGRKSAIYYIAKILGYDVIYFF